MTEQRQSFWRRRALPGLLALFLVLGGGLPTGPVFGSPTGPAFGPPSGPSAPAAASNGAKATATPTEDDDALSEMEKRLELVFRRLIEVIAPRHPEVAQYTIQPVLEKVPNAWINQNNEIFVTSGLLELLPEDDALAGVIGHEIAHGTQGHIPHRIHQSLWSAFAVIALGTIAGTQGSSDWGGLLHMRDLFMYAFSREQESEADLVGMGYARDAGYRPDGLVEALKAMDEERRRLPDDSVWQQLYRTHPSMSQRVTDLRLVLATDWLDRAMRPGPELAGGLAAVGGGPTSPEEAVAGFARALLAGDKGALRRYVLPGQTVAFLDGAALESEAGDWSEAELEVVSRTEDALAVTFVVRLWRSATDAESAAGVAAGPDGGDVGSGPWAITLRQSARGWVVVGWQPHP